MNQIVSKRVLSPAVTRFEIEAPRIARKHQPGQFVILRVHEGGERIPLTIADADPERGTITLIVQRIGHTTTELSALEEGDVIIDLCGPLGSPTHLEKFGNAVVVGGGVGTAVVYPIAKGLKAAGNTVWAIIGAQSAPLLLLEEELRSFCDEVAITTDDGSKGYKGFVSALLQEWIAAGRPIDYVMAAGPVPMMRAVCEVTRPVGIKTVVSLNPIMVDGTGMCGGCRVSIGGEAKYTCVDGPEFDGHLVDFDLLMRRLRMYRPQEEESLHRCKLEEAGWTLKNG
jgi:ferredoxin--NADP+ reductase